MNACQTCRNQMLEHLYGLLDPADERALLDHVAGCADCQAARTQAQGQQRLLAAAARGSFPGVTFQPPAEPAPAAPASKPAPSAPEPAVLPFPAARHWSFGWAAAAAVLLAVGLVGAWTALDYSRLRDTVVQHQQAVTQAAARAEEVRRQLAALPQDEKARLEEVKREVARAELKVQVAGPQQVQPGAPAAFHLRTRAGDGQPASALVDARLVSPQGTAVAERKNVPVAGDTQLTFAAPPSGVGLFPGQALTLEVNARPAPSASKADSTAELPATRLTQPVRLAQPALVTHLMTDKPMYTPGETLRFRSLTLDRARLTPPAEPMYLVYTLTNRQGLRVDVASGTSQLTRPGAPMVGQAAGPRGGTARPPALALATGPDGQPLRGIGTGEYTLPPDLPGGEYTLTVSDRGNRFEPQERKFLVNAYQPGRLNKELTFDRASYAPGDAGSATLKVLRADGSPAAGAAVTATVFIDGATYGPDGRPAAAPPLYKTDAQGGATVPFRLPPATAMSRGEGTLSVNITDGGLNEAIVRPVSIVLNRLTVRFYPEGGDLLAGVPARVYVEVVSPRDRPADLRGRLVDDQGQPVPGAEVQTRTNAALPGVNQGLGVFSFTPEAGRKYLLKIDAPAAVEGRHELPPARDDGVALSIPTGYTTPDQPIRARVQSVQSDREVLVSASCRGQVIAQQAVTAKAGQPVEVTLLPEGDARATGGVVRVTVFEERPTPGAPPALVPRAERLVYREPAGRLKLDVRADKTHYAPGEKVTLGFAARDEQDRPTVAVAAVRAVDLRTVKLADEKTARTLPTHFLLTTEVRQAEDLEYADFLLTDHPEARATLDQLLATKGWRHFVLGGGAAPARPDPDQVVVASAGPPAKDMLEYLGRRQQRLKDEFVERRVTMLAAQAGATAGLEALQHSPAATAAQTSLQRYDEMFRRLRPLALPVLAVVVLAGVAVALVRGLPRTLGQALPYCASLATCAALLAALVLWPGPAALPGPAAGDLAAVKLPVPPELDLAQARAEAEREATIRRGVDVGDRSRPAMMAPMAVPGMPGGPIPLGEGGAEGFGPAGAPAPGGIGKAMPPGAPAPMPMPMRGQPVPAPKDNRFPPEGLDRKDQGAAAARLAPPSPAQAGKNMADQPAAMGRPGVGMRMAIPRAEAIPPVAGGFGGAERPRMAPPAAPLVIREYAHAHLPPADGVRRDFAETLLWHPAFVIPAADAKGAAPATLSFQMADSATTYEVAAFAHTLDGRLGAVTVPVECRLPFTLDVKTPFEVTAGDRLDLPVSLANGTPDARTVRLRATAAGLKLTGGPSEQTVDVPAKASVRRVLRFQPAVTEGEARIEVAGEADAFRDAFARTFRVVPEGFPVTDSKSDLLEGTAKSEVVLPSSWIKGTLRCQVHVYPSTLATLQKGLEGLLREPGGCFEQTSSSSYPNLLVVDYLRESNQANPEVETNALAMLSRGYDKLVSFECPRTPKNDRQGFEWFGAPDSPHEALTAYGLMQFRDLSRVRPVDPTLIERTRACLLAARDGQGGFTRNPRALDTFGRAPGPVTDAYIVWALTETGPDDVARELNALAAKAKDSRDPYFLSLVALGMLNRGRTDEGVSLLKTVASLQKPDGNLDAEATSITGSGGRDLQVETTALALLAWLKANRPQDFTVPVQKAVAWIGRQRSGTGSFGSTQATILALKALIAHTRANKKTAEAGELALLVDGKRVATRPFAAGEQDVLSLDVPNPEATLHPGKNPVQVEITGKNSFPYTLTWSYQSLQPASAEACAVRLSATLDKGTVREGDAVHLTVQLRNVTDKGHGMAVAVIGLPAGLSLPEDLKQLKEHARLREGGTKPGLVSSFETRGRELVLYWRDLAPKQEIEVPVDLVARVPGEYTGPASRAYLYYNADAKHWTAPLKATVEPAK